MRAVGRLLFLAAFFSALVSLACVAPTENATSLAGAYLVVGSLDENTCGAQAVTLPDPWTRRAELLREDTGLYYWREVTSGVRVQGTLSTTGEYRFRGASETELLPADPSLGYAGCRVRLDDDLRFTLEGSASGDGGVDAGPGGNLVGRQATVVSIIAGSDCSPVLNANGGNFLALPCQFAYDLAGEIED